MTDKICRTCRWAETDQISDRICVNADSEHCADWVDDDDFCDKWEGKEK